MSSSEKNRRLVETAILIAMAIVLEFVSKLFPFQLPFGGGITIVSMLPLVMISMRHGVKWGLFSAFVYSLLQMATGHATMTAYFIGEEAMSLGNALLITFIDYILAFTVLGFGGIFMNKIKSTTLAMALGSVFAIGLRYIAHIISGFLFWGSYAEWFFTQDGMGDFGGWFLDAFSGKTLAFVYSIIYNGTYMIPEIILTTLAVIALSKVPSITRK